MSDNIDIVVREQGTKEAAEGLRTIAASSIKAADNVSRLNKELRGLKLGSAVVNDMQKMLTMANKIIASNTGLAASQTKLAAAGAKLAEADQRVALARQRVATETQKTQKAMADAEAAIMRGIAATTRSAIEDTRLAAGKVKLQQETAKLSTVQLKGAADAQRLAEATAKAATAAQRLTTEQQRTVTAMNQAAAATTNAITATTNAATATARLATEQQRTSAAATAALTAQQNLAAATSRAAQAATNAQSATQRLTAEQSKVKTAAANAAAASDRAAMAALRLSEAQKKAATTSRSSANSLADFAKQALAVAGITASISAVGHLADSYTNMQNKLVNLAPDMRTVNKLHNEMFEIANKTRQPVAAVTTAFQRFDMAMVDLGASQAESLRMTETINKAIVVSGATATESAAGLLQLAQAFGSGRLQGDEFRSIMENLPVVADMIAKSMGKTRSELKKLSTDGKITADVMRKAFAEAATDIDARFGKTVPTMGQAMNVLGNNMERFIGQLDKATGTTAAISKGILWLADNLKLIAVAAATGGAAMALYYGPQMVSLLGKARTAMIAFNVAVLANPIVLIGTAIVGTIAAIAAYGDEVKVSADKTITLKDVGIAALELLGDAFKSAGSLIKDGWNATIDYVNERTGGMGEKFRDLFSYLGNLLKANANSFIGTFVGAYNAIGSLWNKFPVLMKDVFANVVNYGAEAVEYVVNAWQSGFRLITSGMEKIAPETAKSLQGALDAMRIEVPRMEVGPGVKSTLAEIGTDFKAAFDVDYVGKGLDAVMAKAAEVSKRRRADEAADAAAQLRGAGKNNNSPVVDKAAEKAATKAAKELAKLKKALQEVRGEVSPTDNAIKQLAKAQETLNKAVATTDPITKKQLITQSEANEIMDRLRQKYEAAINPIGEYNRLLNQQNALLLLNPKARQDEAAMIDFTNQMLSKNIILTEKQTAAAREGIVAQRLRAEASAAADQIYNDTKGAVDSLRVRQEALNLAVANGSITQQYYTSQMAQANIAMADLQNKMGNGTAVSIFTAGVGQAISGFTTLASSAADIIGNVMNSVIDGFSNSVARAIVMGEDLKTSLQSLAQTVVTEMLSALIKMGVQYTINQALGVGSAAAVGAAQTAAIAATTTASVAGTATAAAASATAGAATAAAWTPAAIWASIGSFGQAAVIAGGAILAVKAIGGFEQGGYTGNGGRKQVAGAVHGQEYVMTADTVDRVGLGALDAIQNGADVGGGRTVVEGPGRSSGSAEPRVVVTIINNADNTRITQSETRDEQGNTDIRVQMDNIEQTMAARLDSGQGPLSQSITKNYGVGHQTVQR